MEERGQRRIKKEARRRKEAHTEDEKEERKGEKGEGGESQKETGCSSFFSDVGHKLGAQ